MKSFLYFYLLWIFNGKLNEMMVAVWVEGAVLRFFVEMKDLASFHILRLYEVDGFM